MKILLLLAVLVAVDAAATRENCKVGEWSEWQEELTPHDERTSKSFPSTERIDGREIRLQMMKQKEELTEHRRKCRADGSCPELMERQSEGFIPCVDGFISSPTNGELSCSNIDQQSFMNFADLLVSGNPSGNDIWGWVDPETAREYAIMGTTAGTTFVDITDPQSPVAKCYMDTATVASSWRDMKVVNDWAFIVSEAMGHGIQAFDLTRLRTVEDGSTCAPDWRQETVGNCHNIIANPSKNKIYAVGCTAGTHCADNGGLYIVDVSDPANPTMPNINNNCYDGDGYVHDAQCVVYNGPDTAHVGKDICFCYNENTLTIVDVDDGNNIVELSRTGYLNSQYTHQGWVTDDHTVLLLDDELDEQNGDGITRTYMWDITNLENPVLENVYNHGIRSIDHNQYVVGDRTFQANYASGLRVLDIDQAGYTLSPAGHFDVLGGLDAAVFVGSWSVYPYFPSGNVVISSIDFGMFVVKPNFAAMDAAADKTFTARHRYRNILSADDRASCPRLMETERFEV